MRFQFHQLLMPITGLLIALNGLSAQQSVDSTENDTNLAKYFTAESRKLSRACLADIKTPADWIKKKSELREQLYEMLGLSPLPEKDDLKVVYTGTIEQEDFVVKKLHFQSRPGLYVTGNLYLPKGTHKNLPAILYVCGHGKVSKNGISYGNKVHYHHHGSWFARNGYVCLTIDTLQLGEIEGIHHGTYREKMWWWLNRGYTPAGVEAWNCVRAVDLLQSLPEVDGDRIGVTGRSGGGAYSWWIAAIDERIKCAVPVAGITDLENHVVDGCVEGHCDCMFKVNTYRWDYPMVAALVAPRPLLISNTDSDRIFPLDGVYRTYRHVKRIYALEGAADKVGLHITNGPHKDTQELRIHAFRWFNRYLKRDDSLINKPAEKYFEPEELKVFKELPKDQINTKVHETFVPAAEIQQPRNISQWKQTASQLKDTIRAKCFRGLPAQDDDLNIEVGKTTVGDSPIKTTRVKFESQMYVPLSMTILHRGDLKSIKHFGLMVVGEDDAKAFGNYAESTSKDLEKVIAKRAAAFDKRKIESVPQILDDSKAFVFFTPRGVGTNQWNSNLRFQTQARRRFYLLGQTADTMRVYDILRAITALRQLGNDQSKVSLQAKGKMAINSVYASILDGNVYRAQLLEPTSSHRQGPFYLNVRRVLDVPQAIAVASMKTQIVIRTEDPKRFKFARIVGEMGGKNAVRIVK